MTTARYDGHTAWYDEFASTPPFVMLRETVVRLLGPGPGRCLDLGCGTGRALPLLADAGWDLTGVDVSADQLAAARAHAGDDVELLQIDGHVLPFADASFGGVVSILTHTDFDDAARVFAEVARVLAPGGTFVYAGVHPCFASPFAQALEDGTTLLHPGYRERGWQTVSRNPDSPGVRSKVGVNHTPLAELVTAILDAGLSLDAFEEPGQRDPPLFLAFRTRR
jgi:SAM-dependent methyltransferase